jgi:hypothetical protein
MLWRRLTNQTNKKGGGQQNPGTPRTPRNQRGGATSPANNPPSPDPNATAGGDPNAQTGGGTLNVGGAPATQTGGAPAPFALNPGVAMGNAILDCNQKTAEWLWDTTAKSLCSEPKDEIELLQPQVPTFLAKTALRLALVGSSILHIFSQLRNICQCHAEHALAQFKVKALTHMGTPTRLAQDDDAFAAMLWNSISDSAIAVMALQASDCTINGVISGLLLFKCLPLNSKVKASHNASLIIRKLGKALCMMQAT